MTGSARRLGGRGGALRPSGATRRILRNHLAARARPRPGRHSFTQIVLSIVMVVIVATGALAGVAAVAFSSVINLLGSDLPNPANLAALTFAQPTIVYDRTGTVELARFEREKRRVVSYSEVPPLVLDATTTAEDRTFWENDGFDVAAIVAAAVQNASGDGDVERGASTITQQLVRARLLPKQVIDGGDRYMRKILEIIQASRLTTAFPGEEGKQKIIAAYLNEIYYGHEAYGIAAAAEIYFGVRDLTELTPAQAALLAGLPKAPSTYDPYRYAVKDADGRLVVPSTSPPVVRRDYILRGLASSRWTQLSPEALEAALQEPVVLSGVQPRIMKAPHFAWAVRTELEQLLGGRDAVETGGYRVITTLDWDAQQLAERYLLGAAVIPNLSRVRGEALLSRLHFSKADRTWIRALRGKDVHNGSLVALDYRNGDVLAYVGSAGYYRNDMAGPEFAPQHDAAAAFRQPGSAFKAVVYATAFDQKILTPGSLLLDIRTDFGGGWKPGDFDGLERGPVLVRKAIQQSLNLPAIRAYERVGSTAIADTSERLGLTFTGGRKALVQAGLAAAIGTVETSPIDLTSAFGAFGNGGVRVPTRTILSIEGPSGAETYRAPDPEGVQAVSPEAAFLMSDVLAGNTDPDQNAFWSKTLAIRNGPDGERREAAAKTGTADEWRDFSTYGYLPAPKDPDKPAIAVGVWMGNSDHSVPRSRVHAMSLDTAGEVWHAFLRDYTKDWPLARFVKPDGVVQATIDRWSGGDPGPWTHGTVKEWFIKGTQPGGKREVDQRGLLYTESCGSWMVDPLKAELGPKRWLDDVAAWLRRALDGHTAYSPGAGQLIGPCDPGNGNGNGNGDGGHGHGHDPTPSPPPL